MAARLLSPACVISRAEPAVSAATTGLMRSLRIIFRHWPSACTRLSTVLMPARAGTSFSKWRHATQMNSALPHIGIILTALLELPDAYRGTANGQTTRVHHLIGRGGNDLAARGARAAGSSTGDRCHGHTQASPHKHAGDRV